MKTKNYFLLIPLLLFFVAAIKYGDVFVANQALFTQNVTIGNGTTTAYINGDGRFTGLINVPHAELYNITPNGYSITISAINTLYNFTNLATNELKHFTANDNGIQANKSGYYKLDYSVSFGGGAGSTYYVSATINNVEHTPCRLYRKLGTGGDVGNAGSTCIFYLNAGDNLSGVIADYDLPAQNAVIWAVNVNVVQIG